MTTLTAVWIAIRIVSNPLSNVYQKMLTRQAADPMMIIVMTYGLLSLGCFPLLLVSVPPDLPRSFWGWMVLACAMAVVSNACLVQALKTTDLSILGPINAYKSVISVVAGIFLLGEIPSRSGMLGILLILAGSYFLVEKTPGQSRKHALAHFLRNSGVRMRFLALLLSALEAVIQKRALPGASPLLAFLVWSVFGFFIGIAMAAVLLRRQVFEQTRLLFRQFPTALRLALMTGLMEISTLFTFGKMQVGYSLALFQTSSLLSVFLGYRYFKEENILKRLVGTGIMILGVVLIVLTNL